MKQLEKAIGLSMNDIHVVLPALKEAYTRIYKDYRELTHPKLKMLDGLIILSLVTFIIQLAYAQIAGQDPYNSLLAGLFCSLGQFALCGKFTLVLNFKHLSEYSSVMWHSMISQTKKQLESLY